MRVKNTEQIQPVDRRGLKVIHHIAVETWPVAYGHILKKEQLEYMLNRFYSSESLSKSMDEGHLYFVYLENEIPLGFVSIQFMDDGKSMKIHKLYVLPNQQGKGIGEKLFEKAIERMKKEGFKRLFLNVNRFNASLQFYLKMGMHIQKEEDINIGHGYLMEDFVMEKIYEYV